MPAGTIQKSQPGIGSCVDENEPVEDSPEADPVTAVRDAEDWLADEDTRDSPGIAAADDSCDVFVTFFSILPTESDDGVWEDVLSAFVVPPIIPVLVWLSCDTDGWICVELPVSAAFTAV
ncbi:MAG: hypothetical protein ABFC24_11530 [Methanoregulaceae archaeon]